MITDSKKCHYLAVKELSALLRGITSKHDGDFYCLYWLHSYKKKHRDIKLVTTDKRRNQLVSQPNYHTAKWISKSLLAIEMKKIKVKINKPVYLALSILEISTTLMYEFWYDHIKPKDKQNAKLCYMETDKIKTGDFYKDIAGDIEKYLTQQIVKSIDRCLQERIKE